MPMRADLPDGVTASAGIVAWAIPLTAEPSAAEADRALHRALVFVATEAVSPPRPVSSGEASGSPFT